MPAKKFFSDGNSIFQDICLLPWFGLHLVRKSSMLIQKGVVYQKTSSLSSFDHLLDRHGTADGLDK